MQSPIDISKFHVVVGAAKSGRAAALLLKAHGAQVFLTESGPASKFPAAAAELAHAGVEHEFGGHSPRAHSAGVLVVSPGVPSDAPIVLEALGRGAEVMSEIELGSRFFEGDIVAITGTNGKTTTTALTGDICIRAGKRTIVAGNIGTAFCETLLHQGDADIAVLEVSSFQLDHCTHIHPRVAMITTLTPDHLYRYHGSFEEYTASKQRVFMNQTADDDIIFSTDSDALAAAVASAPSHPLPVSTTRVLKQGGWITHGELVMRCGGEKERIAPLNALQIRGRHNHANILMAALAARRLGIPAEAIRAAVLSFRGVEHRLEAVRMLEGVEWINDSKATNVDSVVIALESMSQPVVLIAGGRDKGSPYDPLFRLVAAKVKALVLLGEAADRMEAAFKGLTVIHRAVTMEEAVTEAQALATSGDAVLLSPACASFDMFESFEHRGFVFKSAVSGLEESH